MKLKYKENYEEACQRLEAFWHHDMVDRPAIAITAPKNGVEYKPCRTSPAIGFQAAMGTKEDKLRLLKAFEEQAATTFYGGEAMPYLEPTIGPDAMGAMLGCHLTCGPHTTWAAPCITGELGDFEVKLDTSEGSYYRKLKETVEIYAEYSKGKFLVGQLDYHTNIDALSALRGPENLCMDIMDEPEEVHRIVDAIDALYPTVFEMAYEAGNMAEQGCIGWGPIYAAPGNRFAILQCDFSCMLSAGQGREFVFPSIRRESAHLDRRIYHLDGKSALQHLDEVLTIDEIECIQWVPGAGNPATIYWPEVLQKIQKAGKAVWIYDCTAGEILAHKNELDPSLVFYSLSVDSEDEAKRFLEAMKQ